MLPEVLWPSAYELAIDRFEVIGNCIVVEAHGTQMSSPCPECQTVSARKHSTYTRHPIDLPCAAYEIQFKLTVPRFFCDKRTCPRRTFAAPFSAFLERYGRRTKRLNEKLTQLGVAVSGEMGRRLSRLMCMEFSGDTLIRLVRQLPDRPAESPTVIGIDDWALRKGQTYGTIVVDLEQQQVIDLLPERSATAVATWLTEHPEIEIVSRDRGNEYINGITAGAPEAIQVADRFHLLQNMTDLLQKVMQKQTQALRQVVREVTAETQQQELQASNSGEQERKATGIAKRKTVREAIFDEVKHLQAQGWSRRAVAKHLQIHQRTVAKYFESDSYPTRNHGPQSTSTVMPYMDVLRQKWADGCQNIAQLHRDLQAQGYEGSYMSVRRAIHKMLQEGHINHVAQPVPSPIPKLTARQAAWLMILDEEQLDELQLKWRDRLCADHDQIRLARTLAVEFGTIIRERLVHELDSWLAKAKRSGLKHFANFATGLDRDYAAVKNALIFEWSNGQVEGQVNKLKFIKRQMYGRAKFDLLRKKVLYQSLET